MNNQELIHLIMSRISQMDESAHYIYDEITDTIEKYVDGKLVDTNSIF